MVKYGKVCTMNYNKQYGKVWYSMYKYVLVIVHTSIDKYGKVWYSMYYYENNSNNTR